jgi:transcriptional regulator GlxA family with amidase domain
MVRSTLLTRAAFALALLTFALPNAARPADNPKADPPKKRVVGIVVFPDVEALDFVGPYEVFSFAHTHAAPPADAPKGTAGRMDYLFDVRVVAATTEPVAVRGGLKVVPTTAFKDCPQVDILVVPGGRGKDAALKDKALLGWVTKQAAKAELVTSVCTGSFVLAEAGLLDGKASATHQLALKEMQAQYPKVKVVEGKRVVEDGNVVTAAGVSSGLDMSLRVVGRLHGDEVARRVARIIEYPYPATADPAPKK